MVIIAQVVVTGSNHVEEYFFLALEWLEKIFDNKTIVWPLPSQQNIFLHLEKGGLFWVHFFCPKASSRSSTSALPVFLWHLPEMEKRADAADASVIFFSLAVLIC